MEVPCELLLHPELLSNEQLKQVILQRYLKLPNLHIMQRDQLLDIFHQFCVPYGQRRYRDSGRGKILNKARHMSPETPPKLNIMTNNQSYNSNFQSYHSERLKPPPEMLSGHMKRIKLDCKAETEKSDLNSNKRKVYMNSISMDCPTPPKKERKPITWP